MDESIASAKIAPKALELQQIRLRTFFSRLMRKRRASFMIDPKMVPTVRFDGRKTNLLQTMSKTIVLCCVAYDERYTIFPYRAFFTWAMPSNTHTQTN